MDKDRIKGTFDQAKGATKEAAGRVLHDPKLRAEGEYDKLKGKTESAIGKAKDTIRDAQHKLDEDKKH